jgi:hypothetical protein
LTWACANFKISSINIASESDTPKQFIAGPLDQQGFGLCTPAGPGDSAECNYNPQDGAAAGTIPISALDVCGTDDNEPLVFSLGLTAVEEGGAEFSNLPIQCAAAPPTPTTPTTTTPSAAGPPGGTGGGFGGGTGGGAGGVRGAEDSGQVPLGGVQSGAGGTAPADDGGAGLLAAVVGLTLAATLGLGIARVRSVRG